MRVELLAYNSAQNLIKETENEIDNDEMLQHLSYTFAIEEISRACSHQLVRHRLASFSQQSQRYISVKKLSERVVTPKSIDKSSKKSYQDFVSSASKAYIDLVEKGVPREDARFVLPNATETSLLMTMEGSSLIHFFGLRCCNRAQWEIRDLAEKMLKQARSAEPIIFNKAGPYCFQLGYCPEGRFSCGRMEETIEKYMV